MTTYRALRIAKVTRETTDAISVALEVPQELRDAYRFAPGQHLNVRALVNGEELRRTYSICGATPTGLRIAIKRIADGRFSHWANATLQAGGSLETEPPVGRFVLLPGDGTARHIVAFAAGAGITPIIAMVRHALANEPNTTVTLIYGNRAPENIIFREELEDLKDRWLGRFTLLHVLSRNEESSTPLFEGRITGEKVKALAQTLFKPAEVAHVFLCGPGSMIKETRNALMDLGMPRERVHHEFFAPAGGAYRGKGIAPGTGAATTPTVSAASPQRSEEKPREPVHTEGTEVVAVLDGIRHRFRVAPGGTVVDAALAAGLRVPYSCKGGMCCTCRAKLVEGQAEMRVNYSLEPWEMERGFILTCQAVPKSERLVLDYDAM